MAVLAAKPNNRRRVSLLPSQWRPTRDPKSPARAYHHPPPRLEDEAMPEGEPQQPSRGREIGIRKMGSGCVAIHGALQSMVPVHGMHDALLEDAVFAALRCL